MIVLRPPPPAEDGKTRCLPIAAKVEEIIFLRNFAAKEPGCKVRSICKEGEESEEGCLVRAGGQTHIRRHLGFKISLS